MHVTLGDIQPLRFADQYHCLLELCLGPLWVELVEEEEQNDLHCLPVGMIKHVSAMNERAHTVDIQDVVVNWLAGVLAPKQHDTSHQSDASTA